MTDTTTKLGAAALALTLLGACAPGMTNGVAGDQEINSPSFSGVNNTDAADGSYTPPTTP